MTGAFLYLTYCSFRNGVRVRLRRLKQPRYLIGTIVGVLYFYFFLFGGLSRNRPNRGPQSVSSLIERAGVSIEFVGAMLLFVIAALAWAWPGSRRALVFSRADVQFLFPAPVTRQQLLHYKLLRSQVGALFGSLLITLVFRPGSLAASGVFIAGIWIVSTALSLHLIGVSLTRESLVSHGRRGIARQRLPLLVVVAALVAIASAIAPVWSQLAAMPNARDALSELQRVTSAGPAALVLWPFRAIVRLPLARSGSEFLQALPWALIVIALNYVWVLRADTAFEEASAEQAEKVAKAAPGRAQPSLRKTASTPFKLAAAGPPETAILWKNLILVGRYVSLKTLFRLLPLIVVFGVLITRDPGRGGIAQTIGVFSMMMATMVLVIGPVAARNDLRQDLANLALLKTWPVRGAALLRGELLAPAVLLTGLIAMLIIVAALSFGESRMASEFTEKRVTYAAVALLVAPGIIAVQVLVQNGFAVLFPAWVTIGPARGRGIDAMGQRLVLMIASLLALAVLVIPAGLAVTLMGLGSYWVLHRVPIVPLAAAATTLLFAECWVASELLGAVLDRTDVSAVEATEQ